MAKPQFFISYSHADDPEWVRRFSKSLAKKGIPVWMDELKVRAGDDIRDAIEKGMRESDTVVSIISADDPRSPNTLFELGAALGMGKRLVAIVPENFDPASLPFSLRTRRFLVRHSPEETADALVGEAS